MINKTSFVALLCTIALSLVFTSVLTAWQATAARVDEGTMTQPAVSANEIQPGETIQMTSQFPVLSSAAGRSYQFDVTLNYKAMGFKLFGLKAKVPQGFTYSIVPASGGSGIEITAIRLDGTKPYGDNIKLTVTPYAWQIPSPGSYPITLEADSGELKTSLELTAVVTNSYALTLTTPDDRLNSIATTGQDNGLTVILTNTGSGDLERVSVTIPANSRPSDWTTKASPEKIDIIKAGESKEVQITVRPTEKTVAGDYLVTIQAEPEDKTTSANLKLRVTALTSGSWGWVGVGVVILVAAALAIIFRKFGRR
jgi:uncharacterized membrane protein